ncbi:MAG: class I SAM-dependent methyltransferase [Candidatus Cloacimonetes bacterium]|nr:class I SAM-dependent methyltransferase [Candidatus Cloacimonadota bacterium]
MLKRIIEDHQNEVFSGIENARKYAEESEKSSKMRFRGFLKKLDDLNILGNYLEIGAGSGTLAAMIAKRNKDINITAIEISSDMITVANEYIKKKSLESQIKFIEGNIEDDKLSEKLGKFDLVYSTFSLHHWENPAKGIKNLMQFVKEDGVLLIYDLKRVWWLYWIPKQNGFFKSIRAAYRPNEIKQLLEESSITKYEISNIFPYFIQNITIWK